MPWRSQLTKLLLNLALALGSLALALALFFFFQLSVLMLIFTDFPVGIRDEAQLERHFQSHRGRLEAVVTEALAANVTSARRGYWDWFGRHEASPSGESYTALYRAMRRAKIQQVQAGRESIVLTTDNIGFWDDGFIGYAWTPAKPLAADDEDGYNLGFDKEIRLTSDWSIIYWLGSD